MNLNLNLNRGLFLGGTTEPEPEPEPEPGVVRTIFSRGEVSLPVYRSDDEFAPPFRTHVMTVELTWAGTGRFGEGETGDASVVRFATYANHIHR